MLTMRELIGDKAFYDNRVDVEVTIVRETLKAYLISFDGKKKWVPKSWIIGYKNIHNKKMPDNNIRS